MLRFPRFENSSPFGHKKMVPAPSPNLRRASFEMAKPTATVTTPPTSLGARVAVYGASIFDPTPSSPLWIWGFPSMGVPPNGWFVSGKIPLKWMIWGYPYFVKPPYGFHLRIKVLFICKRRFFAHERIDGANLSQLHGFLLRRLYYVILVKVMLLRCAQTACKRQL